MLRIAYRFICLFFICTVASKHAYASDEAVLLLNNQDEIQLSSYLSVLEDGAGLLTFDKVSSHSSDLRFDPLKSSSIRIENPDSHYWLKLVLRADDAIDEMQRWYLHINRHPDLERVVYFESQSTGDVYRRTDTGRAVSYENRDVDSLPFVFELTVTPGIEKTLFILIDQDSVPAVGSHAFVLKSEGRFRQFERFNLTVVSGFYGIVLALLLYNFFLWLKLREVAHTYYILYIVFEMLGLAIGDGVAAKLFPEVQLPFGIVVSRLLFITAVLMQMYFVYTVLGLGKHMPVSRYIAISYTILLGLISILVLLQGFDEQHSRLISLVNAVGWLLVLFCLFYAVFQKIPNSGYMLVAEAIAIAGHAIFLLGSLGVVEANDFTAYAAGKTGIAIQLILFSLVLGSRAIHAIRQSFDHERELVEAQRKIIEVQESSLALKSNFITSISHELRTPMNAIIGGMQLIQDEKNERIQSTIGIVREGADEMMGLIDDILTHTEIQSHSLSRRLESFSAVVFFESLKTKYEGLCQQKGLELRWKVSPHVPEIILSDEEKLRTILVKLLDNSVKFTDGGYVSLRANIKGSDSDLKLCFDVSDSGVGIEDDKQERIFDSFSQGEGGFQRRYGGVGIGLSNCKQLTEFLGGVLALESQKGQGCTFSVILPVCRGAEPVAGHADSLAAATLPLLVVEDNVVNQKVLQKLLCKLGYDSRVASHGIEGLALLESESFSMVLMDLQMPIMDGFQCASEIRKLDGDISRIPIVAVTANIMDVDRARCVECGFDDYMEKPITLPVLKGLIEHFVEPASEWNEYSN